MNKEILIDVDCGETRVAITENGILTEIYIERSPIEITAGNVYKGKVENVLPGMQAAFVDIGLEKNAFLFVADARCPDAKTTIMGNMNKLSIGQLLKSGQNLVVQVTKEALGTKGSRVTTNITMPGRYLVLMPTVDYIGISRRIVDEEERNRLRSLAEEVKPEGMGLIVRTVAEGRGKEEFTQDVQYLQSLWVSVLQRFQTKADVGIIYRDLDIICRTIRDLLDRDVTKLVINHKKTYERVLEFVGLLETAYKPKVELYEGNTPILDEHGVESELERALKRKVWLKSGGYLVVDQVEALTVIDVNTGKYIGSTNLADTVLKTNLEAAQEIAKQLRLRDIGGIIIIDFIDMELPEHQEQVVQTLQSALAQDKTKTNILGITQLGLVEMTRKRVRHGLDRMMQKNCSHCDGTGKVISEETVSLRVQREVRKVARYNPQAEAVFIQVNPYVASLLIGPNGQGLERLEQEISKEIFIKGCGDMKTEEIKVVLGTKDEVEHRALPVRLGQKIELHVEEGHATNIQNGIARLQGYVIDVEGGGHLIGKNARCQITKVFKTYAKARIIGSPEEEVFMDMTI